MLATLLLAAVPLFAPPALAAQGDPVASGSLALTLSSGFKRQLKSNGVKMSRREFTIEEGSIDPKNGTGSLTLDGKLKFKKGARKAGFKRLTVTLGKGGLLRGDWQQAVPAQCRQRRSSGLRRRDQWHQGEAAAKGRQDHQPQAGAAFPARRQRGQGLDLRATEDRAGEKRPDEGGSEPRFERRHRLQTVQPLRGPGLGRQRDSTGAAGPQPELHLPGDGRDDRPERQGKV